MPTAGAAAGFAGPGPGTPGENAAGGTVAGPMTAAAGAGIPVAEGAG
ncbi:MAG: hypothetical protein ACYDCL_05295 [Myxococcales bacterium]